MPRFYVFPDEASAQACVAGVDARARQIYTEHKFTEDTATGGFVSKDVNGNDIPGAVTTSFAVPWQRADGNWVVAHCETVPYAAVVLEPLTKPVQCVEGRWQDHSFPMAYGLRSHRCCHLSQPSRRAVAREDLTARR